MKRAFLTSALLLGVLSSCVLTPAAPTDLPPTVSLTAPTVEPTVFAASIPKDSPTPRVISPTPKESLTPVPSLTSEPTSTDTPLPLPSLAPPTPLVTEYPQPAAGSAAIQILTPGPLSKVVSPIQLRSYAIPGFSSRVRIELYGEDGRLLVRKILLLNTALKWGYIYQEIPFEVHAAGELGRLSVSTQDQNGHTTALYSVRLLLLSEGEAQITPPGNLEERCVIENPGAGALLSKGHLTVDGEMRPFSSQPLVVELVSRSGTVLGSRQVNMAPTRNDTYVPFQADLSFSVVEVTPVLLVVRQSDDRIPGGMYLYSQAITLKP